MVVRNVDPSWDSTSRERENLECGEVRSNELGNCEIASVRSSEECEALTLKVRTPRQRLDESRSGIDEGGEFE